MFSYSYYEQTGEKDRRHGVDEVSNAPDLRAVGAQAHEQHRHRQSAQPRREDEEDIAGIDELDDVSTAIMREMAAYIPFQLLFARSR